MGERQITALFVGDMNSHTVRHIAKHIESNIRYSPSDTNLDFQYLGATTEINACFPGHDGIHFIAV